MPSCWCWRSGCIGALPETRWAISSEKRTDVSSGVLTLEKREALRLIRTNGYGETYIVVYAEGAARWKGKDTSGQGDR